MRLFISHSSVDRDAVRELVNVLESAGHEVWFDLWLLPGQNWRQQVISAIENSQALVYVLTPESVDSEGCRWEFSKAVQQDKPVIPVLLHPKAPIPDELSRYPYVDFTAGPTPEAVARLMAELYRSAVPTLAKRAPQKAAESGSSPTPLPDDMRALSFEDRINLIFAIIGSIAGVVTVILGLMAKMGSSAGVVPASLGPGPVVIFGLAAVLFTVLRRLTISVAILLGAEIALSVIYLSVKSFGPLDYFLLAALLLLGYTIGRMRLLLWPWFSFRIARQHDHLKRRLERGTGVRESAAALLLLLNEPIAFTPYGSAAALRTLAAHGFSLDTFVDRVHVGPRREMYRDIIRKSALEKLKNAARLEAVLEIPELAALIPDERPALESWLRAAQASATGIERVRAYAQLLWVLNDAQEKAPADQTPVREQQKQALLHISRLAYQAFDPADVASYWSTYESFTAVVDHIPAVVSIPVDEEDLRQAVHHGLLQVTAILELVRCIESGLASFPAQERKWYRSIMETGLINDQLLSTDHQERQALLSREIGRLQILSNSLPPAWLAIDRDLTQVVEHTNPWHVITGRLVEHLETIQHLDARYVASAARALTRVLQEIDDIRAIAELEQRLVNLTISGDSFGPLIGDTLQALLAIGNDTRAALALPQGTYHHRQTLIDAQDKSNQLRNSLSTRYVTQEPRDWAESVQKMSTILDEYLNQQSEAEQTLYRNPYIVGNPLQPKNAALFKGRIELAQEIVDKLRGDTRPTLVLHGPRRMGKTSFLLQLQNLLQGRGNYIPVFFNAQEPASRQNDASFFYAMARAIYIQMKRLARGRRIRPPDLGQYELHPYTTISTWVEDEVVPLLDQHILLITIDEFEKLGSAIRAGELTEKVLDYLRHMMQHSENMLFLFCGVETLEALGPNAASYFISVQAIEISYLSEDAAEELIHHPNPDAGEMPDYDDDVVAEMMRLTHRQPYLIQAICSKVIDVANVKNFRRIDRPVLDEILPSLFTTNRLFFVNIWEDAGEEGRTILTALAQGPAELTREQVSSAGGQGLLKRHLICLRPDGRYEIEIPLVQSWVAQQV